MPEVWQHFPCAPDGLQAGTIEVVGVKSHAWSATGGNFRLKGMQLDVSLDGGKCFQSCGAAAAGAVTPAAAARLAPDPAVLGRTAGPPTVTASFFAPQGFALAGTAEVPTVDGPLKVLVLRMRAASLRDDRLRTRDGGSEYGLAADSLDLRGDVTLYLTRFSGCIEGLPCVTFSPEGLPAPPADPPRGAGYSQPTWVTNMATTTTRVQPRTCSSHEESSLGPPVRTRSRAGAVGVALSAVMMSNVPAFAPFAVDDDGHVVAPVTPPGPHHAPDSGAAGARRPGRPGQMRVSRLRPAMAAIARPRQRATTPVITLLTTVRVVSISPAMTHGAMIVHAPSATAVQAIAWVRS